jgi:hypothetical protein
LTRELELVRFHIDFPPVKTHAFRLQPETLLHGRVSTQFDFASGPQNALPGKSVAAVKHAGYLPRSAGKSSCAGHGSVR